MPAWGIHLTTAKRILENLEVDKDSFLFGNILPDVNNGYLIKDISVVKEYEETHYSSIYEFEGQRECLPNIESFLCVYKEKMNNAIVLGYFIHILTDYYWNKSFYLKYGILNDKKERIGLKNNIGENYFCNEEEARKLKVNDFNIFSKKLYEENKIDLPIIKENLLNQLDEIKCVKINRNDLEKIKEYLQEEKNKNEESKSVLNYQIYTEQEIYEQFENSISFILQTLKNIKISFKK